MLAGALVALGLCLGGLFIYCGISKYADKDRAVSVKGLSTREVEADYAVWPLSFGWNGNDLPSLYQQIGNVSEKVKQHLLSLGFEESDLRQGTISVDNNWENYYGDHRPEYKYTLRTSIIVSTDKVKLVVASQGKEADLLKEGIIGARDTLIYERTIPETRGVSFIVVGEIPGDTVGVPQGYDYCKRFLDEAELEGKLVGEYRFSITGS